MPETVAPLLEPALAAVLPFVSRVRQSYNQLIQELPGLLEELAQELREASEEGVAELRKGIHTLGKELWRFECACDAELFERARATPGRGNHDITEIGIKAAVRRRAKLVGVTPRTIEKNAQVHRLRKKFVEQHPEKGRFENALLPEKGYYIAALSAANPIEALNAFFNEKQNRPRFRPSDAYRLLESQGLTQAAVTSAALEAARTPERKALLAHYRWASNIILHQLFPNNPDRNAAERIYGNTLSDIKDELGELFYADVSAALRQSWLSGNKAEDSMIRSSGFPPDIAKIIIYRLEDEGEFILVPQPGAAPGTPKLWHLAGQPLPEVLRMRRA